MNQLMGTSNDKRTQMIMALQRAEIPHCNCDHHPIPCGCAEPCDCPTILPPPCKHVLATMHGMSLKTWAEKLAKYLPDEYRNPLIPVRAAAARPGSDAKVEIMARRHERNEHLYHPSDADPRAFVGLGSAFGFAANGAHPRLEILRLQPGAGVRVKPEKEAKHVA